MRLRTALTLVLVAAFTGPPVAYGELHVSPAGVKAIEDFEGFVATPRADPVGVHTVGFGSTSADGPLPAHLTRAQAQRLLIDALDQRYMPPVRALFRGRLRALYTVARADALASASYNLGTGFLTCAPGFASMCQALRSCDPHRIGAAILLYDHAAGARLAGLTRRRRAEAAPWLHPIARFEDFTVRERRLIVAFDRLAGHRSPAHRDALVHRIHAAAGHVARIVRTQHDGLSHRRLIRRATLLRRIPHR